MIIKKLNHIYNCYPLYQLMYGRDFDSKCFESINAAVAAEFYWHRILKMKTPLNVMELFSGVSEHRPYFLQSCKAKIDRYDCLDNEPSVGNDYVKVGDAITDYYGGGYNFLIAHYYSLCTCIFGSDYVHSRQKMVEFFANVKRNIQHPAFSNKPTPNKGAFYFNLSANGYVNSLLNVGEIIKGFYYHIPLDHSMRKLLKIDPYINCSLTATTHRTYDRLTCTNYDWISDVFVRVNGVKIVEFKVERPFTHRFWAETEIVDVLHEVGCDDVMFYNNIITSGDDMLSDHIRLPRIIKYPNIPLADGDIEEGTALSNYMTTDMMVLF